MPQAIVEDNSSLMESLAKLAPDSSKTTLRSWIKEGRVTVDGRLAKRGDDPVTKGQKILVSAKQLMIAEKLRVVYEDSDLIAIDKPVGVLSVETAFDKTETAHAILKHHFHPRKVAVVHRLDQDTSGVMLFALSDKGYHGLKELFAKHDIERSYFAVVEGKIAPNKGTWQSYLYEDSLYVVHSTDDPKKGTIAITHYDVQSTSPRYTLLKLTLETGRKNQIRVHCREAGCPVVGDKKYGAVTNPLKRMCLHASTLSFIHPVTQKAMHFVSPIPDAFYQLTKA
ncbi:MAG: RluA family pseudouridine synthase [Parachlamydiaceae bacterium]